jgi:hypothetical protein
MPVRHSGASPEQWTPDRTIDTDVFPAESPAVEIRTDEPTEVVYRPRVDRVAFDRAVVSPGGTGILTVDTIFAGAGYPVRVDLYDRRGGFGTSTVRLSRPRLRRRVAVPRDAVGTVRAEVRIDGSDTSVPSRGGMVLTDPVHVRDVRWSVPSVRPGQVVRLTARVSPSANGYRATVQVKRRDPTGGGVHEPITSMSPTVRRGRVAVEWIAARPPDLRTGDPAAQADPPVLLAEVNVLGVTARSWGRRNRVRGAPPGQLCINSSA